MSSRRVHKAAQAIREVVSMAILTDLKDPRVENVTVTFVEVSGDLRQAKVHVSVMADDAKKELCLQGLQSAAGYLQKKVGNRIDTRYTPRLKFELDRGIENSMIVTKILDEVLPPETPEQEEGESSDSLEIAASETETADYDGESDSGATDGENSPVGEQNDRDEESEIPGERSTDSRA
ncbi:MAG: 30S ribosome-binding factor RbfA [Planctomycetota bacterium]